MTHAPSSRPRSMAATISSLVLIAVSVPCSVYEFRRTFEGVTSATDAWLAVGASSLSAIVGLIFLAWLARLRPSALAWIATFAWGTGGALIISGFGNGIVDPAIEASGLDESTAEFVTSVVTGPVIEEIAKAIGVIVLVLAARRLLTRPAQGAVLGALVGLGFAWGEDVGYYLSALDDGISGLWESFLARALLGAFGHAIFTAVCGYALAWALTRAVRPPQAILAGIGGLTAAVLVHAQANGVGLVAPEDSWNLTYGAIELPVLAIGLVLLVWGMRRRHDTLEA